jgi:uncharacterized protein (DUF3084 family)
MAFGGVIVPGAAASDLQGLHALLAVIADPAAAKQRLAELQEAAAAAKASEQAAIAAQASNKQTLEEAKTQLTETKQHLELHKQQAQRLVAREVEVKRREDIVTAREREHEQLVHDTLTQVSDRERAVGQREQTVSKREADAENREKVLAFAKQEHDARVAKLKAAVG